MKLIQFFLPGKGKRVGVIQGDRVLDITTVEEDIRCTLDVVTQGKTAQGVVARASWLAKRLHRKGLDWRELRRSPSRRSPHLLVPIDAPEVWGAKDTYAPAGGHAVAGPGCHTAGSEAGTIIGEDCRPALFFKATAHRVVGPHVPVMIRRDSSLTLPGASLAVVMGTAGAVVAFTACNDTTARDIEQSGPAYLSQAKIYLGSCALGPCLVTSDEIEDPHALQIRCSILRSGETRFSETGNTGNLRHPIETLTRWLIRDNPVPPGTVLSTGMAIPMPDAMALASGDQVDIEVQGIGRLSNPVRQALWLVRDRGIGG
jgi:2-dehydro-3-deoxy-D-arabinonate dehydratase